MVIFQARMTSLLDVQSCPLNSTSYQKSTVPPLVSNNGGSHPTNEYNVLWRHPEKSCQLLSNSASFSWSIADQLRIRFAQLTAQYFHRPEPPFLNSAQWCPHAPGSPSPGAKTEAEKSLLQFPLPESTEFYGTGLTTQCVSELPDE